MFGSLQNKLSSSINKQPDAAAPTMAENNANLDPILRDTHNHSDKAGKKLLHETGKLHDKAEAYAPQSHKDAHEKQNKQPAGGFDSTPLPSAPPGYTVKITFHRAHNLPFADFNSLSSDPYLIASLRTDLVKRHKQDPDPVFRTPTIRRSTNPEWDSVWTVAHVPSSGFSMKVRLYDEDPADHDDRLGNVHLHISGISEGWSGLKEKTYEIKKRMASKRAYLIRGCAALIRRSVKMNGDLILSLECLGRSEGDGGRVYTIGPLPWTRHYSPLIGRLTGTKDTSETEDGKKKPEKYNFQAIQMQLAGPVPAPLYHRYVEFKPFVAGMFNSHSLRGWILNRALHHQHNRIYNYDRSTLYGYFQEPCLDMTKQFLDFVHYDHGGRIFTYVLTLNAQWRFTETGKEFGIDMLSKHTMHSDVSSYIAFSGEFFIRRLKNSWQRRFKRSGTEGSKSGDNDNGPDPDVNALLPEAESDAEDDSKPDPNGADSSTDPSNYELIIDNDSGTYRPNAKYLPTLRDYMRQSLPGLRVVTLDCQADAEKMNRLKQEQRDKKRKMKGAVQYMQRGSDSSSISSSDESDLDTLARKNPEAAEENEKQSKAKKLKQGVKMATDGVKNTVAGPAGGEKENENGGGEGSGGMGGIVGEDGPVRMREKKEKLKAMKKAHRSSKTEDADNAALKESSSQEKNEDQKKHEPSGETTDIAKDQDEILDERAVPPNEFPNQSVALSNGTPR
jgi:C2 domain